MTNEQDLDRAIDAAAAGMIAREPNRVLGHAVMARVRQTEERAPQRIIWATAGLGAAACLVVALVMVQRTPTSPVPTRAPLPTINVESPTTVRQSEPSIESVKPAARPVGRRVPRVSLPSNDLLSSIEPISTEPLVLPSIELPTLESEATSVEQIEIAALTIEPLTASND